MSHQGKLQITALIVAPPDQVDEGDRIWRSHAQWMERTHHSGGEKALLRYNLSRAPALSDPADPNSDPTGTMCFILTEVYESEAGVADHFAQADQSWEDYAAANEWLGKCEVRAFQTTQVVHSLW
jgi:hypothetical protein